MTPRLAIARPRRGVDVGPRIARLGRAVLAAWRARQFDEAALPAIAAHALVEAELPAHVTPDDLIDWAERRTELPRQVDLDATFAQPPLTLFYHPRFRIEALFWVDSTTSIHDHNFRGAFQVLSGHSLHACYTFDVDDVVNARFKLGRLRQTAVEHLRRGETRAIELGTAFIHSLFHVERPSVSLVVRSHDDATGSAAFEYHAPSVAINAGVGDATLRRKLQLLSYLGTIGSPRRDRFIEQLLDRCDLAAALLVLQFIAPGDALDLEPYIARVRRRHGARADRFGEVLAEVRRTAFLTRRRRELVTPEHRFFLGLLGVRGRANVLDLVAAAYGGADPAERLVGWLDELAAERPAGDPLALRLGPAERRVFVELLRGATPASLERTLPVRRAELRALCAAFQRSPIFSRWLAP